MSSISALYTAYSGLNAHQRTIDTIAHNVANQGTEGYRRQRVDLRAAGTTAVAGMYAGTANPLRGVDVVSVSRSSDQFAERRLATGLGRSAYADKLATKLASIEDHLNESGEFGIAATLDDFWGAWSDIAINPNDRAVRTQLLERAVALTDSLHRASADLTAIANAASDELLGVANSVNDVAARLATVNSAIASSHGAVPDLADERDRLIRDLASLVGSDARIEESGQATITVAGRTLVDGAKAFGVSASATGLRWDLDHSNVALGPSQAAALTKVINDVVPRYQADLDAVAATLVAKLNGAHVGGFDINGVAAGNFFDPASASAATIKLDANVDGQPDHIAAASAPGALDGELARMIGAFADDTSGAVAQYQGMISALGVEVNAATRNADVQYNVLVSAWEETEAVGGVSIDEEMANLVAVQRGYEASARVLTAVDELLDTLINRTGVVGR